MFNRGTYNSVKYNSIISVAVATDVLSNIVMKVRYLIGDTVRSLSPGDVFIYTVSNVFNLSEENIVAITEVLVNDSEIGAEDRLYDSDTNKLTISSSLTSGDIVEIRYTYYANYSSTVIQSYINASLKNLNKFILINNQLYPEPNLREENLIALITAILIEPDRSYRLPDVTVNLPKDISKDKKIKQVIALYKKNIHGIFNVL